jgi:hypothetical protein
MRITDDRYTVELTRLNLGMRLLKLKAKSATIRNCTGLSEDRVRKLFKTYLESHSIEPVRRKRGKSPHESAFLLRNARAHLQASVLANLLTSLDVTLSGALAHACISTRAERCCDAFEYYLQLFDELEFTFEHAWLLAQLLGPHTEEAAELILVPCHGCHALTLQDPLALPLRPCPFCGEKIHSPNARLSRQTHSPSCYY